MKFLKLHIFVISAKFFKNLVIRFKVGKARALIIEPIPLPPNIKRLALTFVIMVNGVGVDVISQPLVMEK
jgi:hypothetical protein